MTREIVKKEESWALGIILTEKCNCDCKDCKTIKWLLNDQQVGVELT
ncbi:MAG: hypothetical protein ACRC17_08460 [Culicoidibacterales bacterium]